MFGGWKCLAVLLVAVFLLTGPAYALTVHQGVDAAGSTANSQSAFADWQADVSGFTTDDLTGLACGGGPVTCTSSAGNTFTQGVGSLMAAGANLGVVSGANLLLVQPSAPGSFTWTLAQPANAFGFFAYDTDGENVTIAFDDGSAQEFMIATAMGTGDNLFWGITGLGATITSVTITADDTPGFSYWDNFVVGAAVPVPAALPLFVSGLAVFGFVARRRARLGAA